MGYSRQCFYKRKKDACVISCKQTIVKGLVNKERKLLPRIGTRKLYHLIYPDLKELGVKCGRDKLFTILRSYGLLIRPRKRYIQTTMSKHWLRKWPNLIKEKTATLPDEIWVSDITYIKTEQGNCYLNMVTDKCTRKIVGYAVADTMETDKMIEAFHMAIKGKRNPLTPTIHHSDRGLQYCSKDYISLAQDHQIKISMTENGDPYENALAERMNRTIKEEFGLDKTIKTKQLVGEIVKESIDLYNSKRPHLALNMATPNHEYQKKSRILVAPGI